MKKPEMNPGARRYLDEIRNSAQVRPWTMSIEEARSAYDQKQQRINLPALEKCDSKDIIIADTVNARIYTAGIPVKNPVLVYFHGGGWTFGGLGSVDALCHGLCRKSGWTVLSVDYRLSPEHPYPAALDDGRSVLNAILSGEFEDQIDKSRIAVGGDSAGGNIAAVLALEWCSELIAQILIYPVTDRSKKHPSMVEYASGLNLDAPTMEWFWSNYVADPSLNDDWHVSPLRAEVPSQMPPSLMIVAGYDPLVDEGLAYADHLARNGCEIELLAFPDQIHGFATQTVLSASPFLLQDAIAGFLQRRDVAVL